MGAHPPPWVGRHGSIHVPTEEDFEMSTRRFEEVLELADRATDAAKAIYTMAFGENCTDHDCECGGDGECVHCTVENLSLDRVSIVGPRVQEEPSVSAEDCGVPKMLTMVLPWRDVVNLKMFLYRYEDLLSGKIRDLENVKIRGEEHQTAVDKEIRLLSIRHARLLEAQARIEIQFEKNTKELSANGGQADVS
jgi:hypothetical protein